MLDGGSGLARFERHIFVCTNQRDGSAPRGSCAADGNGGLHKLFKEKLASTGLGNSVRANKAGCLDQCEHGPVVVVYPEQVWYGFVQPGDVDEIVREHIVGGRPVMRLTLPEECLNTATCPHKPVPKATPTVAAHTGHGEPGSAEDIALSGVL